jgi:type II secretory ATPase GspE/PulE/Tfp pilus assembly ATPase PilB-like protein
MTHEYVHTLSSQEKVEFYFNKVDQILATQLYGYDHFPGMYELEDQEPVLLECSGYEGINSVELVDRILTYAVAEMVQALIFETQENHLALLIVSNSCISGEKFYHRLLRTKIISRLKLLTSVDPSEKKVPQVGILNISYRSNVYTTRILFFPQKAGESIVILPEKPSKKDDNNNYQF